MYSEKSKFESIWHLFREIQDLQLMMHFLGIYILTLKTKQKWCTYIVICELVKLAHVL